MVTRLSVLLLLGVLAGGCATHKTVIVCPHAAARETYTVNSPYAVLDPGPSTAGQASDPFVYGRRPWWATRNDHRLNYRPEGASRGVTDYVIYTEDRQQSFGDRIFDVHRRVRHSVRYGRLVD